MTILFFTVSLCLAAQSSPKTDSLFNLLKTAKHDTTRIKLYLNIGDIYEYEKPDTAIFFYQKALNLAEKATQNLTGFKNLAGLEARFLSLQATSLSYIGLVNVAKGDYDKAIDLYVKSLKIDEKLGDSPEIEIAMLGKNGMSASYNNIGMIHSNKGDYDKAIDFYFKGLKINEEIGDKEGMSNSYNNISVIHTYKGDYDKAIDLNFKSLKIDEELGNKKGMAASYGNIGVIHMYKGDYDKAIEFIFKSLKIEDELGDKKGMAASYNNIGVIYDYKGNSQLDKETQQEEYDKAIELFFKSLKIQEEIGDKEGMSASYTNIGSLFLKQNKPEDSKKQQLQALNIALEIGAKYQIYLAYSSLARCDSALGNFRGAYEYHKLYSQVHDSVFSKESNDKIAEMGAKYEAEKRELTIQKLEKEKLLQDETLARKEAESKKQRILLFSFLAGFIIILVFSVFLYRLFVQKKKANSVLAQQKEEISAQKDEIEKQRDLVTVQKVHIEEIHKDVTDSINYAKRIQEAVLPVSVAARSIMGEHFVLFKPKDIVSGDFYWTTKINNWLIVAVADCTGHGVPGAFMSMLGISFLNEIVTKQEITKANQILNQLRAEIINALQQKGDTSTSFGSAHFDKLSTAQDASLSGLSDVKDGMDISLCVITTITMECQWSGANNPLFLFSANDKELKEIKPDKQPIAIHPEMKDFTNHEIKLQKGDIIYLLSDGYQDQFGGPATGGKKFKIKQLKELFVNTAAQPMDEQKNILETTFENWKGDHEQIDDVTILGLKI